MQYSSLLIQDLDAAYTSISNHYRLNGIFKTRRQICDIISQSPAPRLYITPEYASRILKAFPKYSARRYGSTGKHRELYERYRSLPPEERNIDGIIKIINQPAPSFYLSSTYIYILLYRIYDGRK